MSCLHYEYHNLYIENISLAQIAQEFGTPCYVYSRAALTANWLAFDQAFQSMPHRICYAVKANSNIAILHLFAQLQSGFDIVSIGELDRVMAAGGDIKKVVFSGVGKTAAEIERAIKAGIGCFNVESAPELERIAAIALQLKQVVAVAIRMNPDVDPRTHAHISTGLKENKFGIEMSDVIPLARTILTLPQLKLVGIACHIGSQITEIAPFLAAIERLLEMYQQLKNIGGEIQHIDIGGGLGITYQHEHPPAIQEYANAIQKLFHKIFSSSQPPCEIILEPGRAIVGNAGVLLTRVEYIKHTPHKHFALVDAGMNDLLRPALYDAWQAILPVTLRAGEKKTYDIVGPVCESADFLGKNRELMIESGDLLAIDTAGAYGFSMSSNYNSRGRPAEILVAGDQARLIRRRETTAELFALENI